VQDPPKCTQIGTFGLKIFHLATLLPAASSYDILLWRVFFAFVPSDLLLKEEAGSHYHLNRENWAAKLRVARWYILKPKIPLWVNFGGPCNERCRYIL
jgi:hypothetical protein